VRLLQSKGRLEHKADGWDQSNLEDGRSQVAGLSVACFNVDVVVKESEDEMEQRHIVESLLWQLCHICGKL
jgi:hypothetical protein